MSQAEEQHIKRNKPVSEKQVVHVFVDLHVSPKGLKDMDGGGTSSNQGNWRKYKSRYLLESQAEF